MYILQKKIRQQARYLYTELYRDPDIDNVFEEATSIIYEGVPICELSIVKVIEIDITIMIQKKEDLERGNKNES